jgi:hypothetical protein
MAGWKFFLNGIEVAEPIGWDAIEFTAKRLPSHGIDSPFSTELTFTGKAAKLIKAEYEAHYINAEIAILIQSNVKVNGSDYAFVGFLNMSIYTEKNVCDTNGWEITVGIIEDNFRERFLSRQGVEIDLLAAKDLDENVITPVVLDTIVTHTQELFLIGKARNYSTQADFMRYIASTGWDLDDFAILLPAYWNNSDFKGVFGDDFNPTSTHYTTASPAFVNNSTFTRTITFNVTANGLFEMWTGTFGADTANITFSIQVKDDTDTETQRFYLYDSPVAAVSDPAATNWSFSVEQDITLDEGDKVYLFMQWGFNGNLVPGTTPTPDTSRSLKYGCLNCCVVATEFNAASNASETNGLTVYRALQRAVYLLTGNPDGLVSDTFSDPDGCFWNNFITTGLYIRNATTIEQAVNGCINEDETNIYAIKTSFEKLYEGLDRIFCLGWQFEQDTYGAWKLRVEKADYFYNNTVVVQSFFKVGQIVQNAMSDKLVNNVKLGYSDKFKNIAVSALTEINADRNYFIANKARIDNSSVSLDIRSDIIASGYAIEFYRRLQFLREDSGSSDRPNDYDLFIIWTNRYEVTVDLDTEPGLGYRLEGETGSKTFAPGTVSYGSNFIAESNGPIDRVYNVYHSPARIACRWWKFLGMHTFGLPTANAILAYQVGQYFTDYSSRIDSTSEPDECMEVANGASDVLSESTNIGPDILTVAAQDYLMKPISVEFDVPQSLCSFIDMSYNGNGLVRVTSGSLDIYGFIQESGNKPQDPNSGLSTIKLIMSKTGLVNGDYKALDYDSDDYFTG